MSKFLSAVNHGLHLIGFELIRANRFDLLIEKLKRQTSTIRFVQIGANDGIRFDSLYFKVTSNRWPGLVVEPLPDQFDRLCINYKDYPEVLTANVAVHPSASEAMIYRVDPRRIGGCPDWAAGIASFLPDHHKRSGIPSELIVTESVKCRSLMDLIRENDMLDANLLQIDTEGFDAEVIKMIDFSLFRPSIIKYENVNLTPTDRSAVESILANQGYKCIFTGNDTIATNL